MGRKEKWCNAFVFLDEPKMSRMFKILETKELRSQLVN